MKTISERTDEELLSRGGRAGRVSRTRKGVRAKKGVRSYYLPAVDEADG